MRALEGIRVIDLSRVLAGPYCTMMLADNGAEVIKVEMPGTGDDSRSFPPHINGESIYFANINRSKKSITLNLKKPEAVGILEKLLSTADVLVENFRPGTMEKFGLGYDFLKEKYPKLIYACGSGFGHTGPWAHKAAYDLVVQAVSGFMSITGQENSIPTKAGTSIMDILTGIFLYSGVVTAICARDKTKQGQKVDVAMLDCGVAILENALASYTATGIIPTRIGNRHPAITPFESFRAKDDYFVIACGNEHLFLKLCEVIGKENLKSDLRFSDNESRTKNQKCLFEILEETFKTKTVSEWVSLLDSVGIPVAPINTVDKLFNNEQVRNREMILNIEHPVIGKMKLTGCPVKYEKTPSSVSSPSPLLGQHTQEILKSLLGAKNSDINKWKTDGII